MGNAQTSAGLRNPELILRVVLSLLDEMSATLKLYFGLSTGAVVLSVNLLAGSHAPRLVRIPLALSIFAFGFAATRCLRVLLSLVGFRMLMARAASAAPDNALVEAEKQIADWAATARKQAKWMERLFWEVMPFAAQRSQRQEQSRAIGAYFWHGFALTVSPDFDNKA